MEVQSESFTHSNMDCATTNTTLLTVFLLLIMVTIPTARGEPDRGQRVGRSDVRAVLGDKLDPSFWPTRGRRALDSSEENPPFWANRGRSLDNLQNYLEERTAAEATSSEDNPPFYANRGRSIHKNNCPQTKKAIPLKLFADEPHWVLLDRRDIDNTHTATDPFWVARGRRAALLDTLGTAPTEFWAARGKKSPTKRSLEALRALELTNDQFWPARGKRELLINLHKTQ